MSFSDHDRELIFKVSGGLPENFPLLHQLHICRNGIHLINECAVSGIIGKSFRQMWQDNGGSKAQVVSFLLKRVMKDPKRKLHIKDLG